MWHQVKLLPDLFGLSSASQVSPFRGGRRIHLLPPISHWSNACSLGHELFYISGLWYLAVPHHLIPQNWQDVHSVGRCKMLFGCVPVKLIRVQPEFVSTVMLGAETSTAITEQVKSRDLKRS